RSSMLIVIYLPYTTLFRSNFNEAKQILIDNQVGGITYFDIMGQGPLDREATERIVQGYKTGEKYTPEFARRTRIETIVDDDKARSEEHTSELQSRDNRVCR